MTSRLSRRIGWLFVAAGVFLWLICGMFMNTFADENKGSFKLICKTPDGVLRNAEQWSVYRIGDSDGKTRSLTGVFAELPVELDVSSSAALTDTARTLETYVRLKKFTPVSSGQTDKDGVLVFDDLENGLYLFVGKPIKLGIKSYIPVSFINEVTPENPDSEIVINPKYTSVLVADGDEWRYTAKKVWTNGGDKIPDEIDADIYCDGELYESIKLGEHNNWSYEWFAEEFHIWDVVERNVPDGFKVVYRSNEWQYVIVNTLAQAQPGIETNTTTSVTSTVTTSTTATTDATGTVIPGSDVTTGSGSSSTSETAISTKTTVIGDSENTPNENEKEKLPQTGQLWWPVPVLALAGIILVAVGFKIGSKEH